MWRVVLGALVLAACASPSPPAEPAASIIDSTPDSTPESTPGSTVAASEQVAAEPTLDPDSVLPDGFELVAARVTEPDGSTCDVCLWLADSGGERAQGLMGVTDLGAADGMAFRYPDPHSSWFWMKNTVVPLSIAFFAPDGSYLDDFDMEPCERNPCPRYYTPDNFLVAVETTQGDLATLGMVPGSSLNCSICPAMVSDAQAVDVAESQAS